ncbi:putative ribonuclease H-like domain-containing protein [Tanacetum coccineum]
MYVSTYCLLYWKNDKDLTACQTCRTSRWKVDNKTKKVYKNIPAKEYRLMGLTSTRETGVDTYDASTKDNFNLRAVVLWTINDYPALGTLCGCPYSGFKGCVVCGKDTNCVRLSASSKQKNQEDTRGRGGKIQKQKRNTTEEEGSSSQVNGQNEKNVAESIVGTLLHVPGKTKDGLNARLDLAELGVKPELFAMQDEDKTTLPPTGGERELAIDKESVSETVLDYRFRQIPLFQCDWVNHKSGGVKRDKLGYTLVSLNNLGHKVDPSY